MITISILILRISIIPITILHTLYYSICCWTSKHTSSAHVDVDTGEIFTTIIVDNFFNHNNKKAKEAKTKQPRNLGVNNTGNN